MNLELALYYVAGALRDTAELMVGNSKRAVFNEWASNKSCSIPTCEINLHLNMLLKNLFIRLLTNFEQNCV